MLKMIGIVLIVGGAGSWGLSQTLRLTRRLRQLRELMSAIELLKCELNYTLLPLSELCSVTAGRAHGAVRCFFETYAQKLSGGRISAVQAALETSRLELPNDAAMAILELFESIGRYDIDGENRLLTLTQERLRTALERLETEKKPLAKSYAVLSMAAGAALVILVA